LSISQDADDERRLHVGDDPAANEVDDPVGPVEHPLVVRDDQDRGPGGAGGEFVEKGEHLLARGGVERGRGLVGEDQRRLVDQRPRDRDPLVLAAGELRR